MYKKQDAIFYIKLLIAIAENEDDAVICNECLGTYRESWFDSKCPYCEIDHSSII